MRSDPTGDQVCGRLRAGRLVLIGTGSVDTALNICESAVVFDGAAWRAIDRPTYADVGAIAGLSNSSLGAFLVPTSMCRGAG